MIHYLHNKQNEEEGFTLIEMLTVVIIISIVTMFSVMAFLNQKKTAIDSSVENDVKAAVVAVEEWQISNPNGNPPDTIVEGIQSTPDTELTILSGAEAGLPKGEYLIQGYNPKGNKAAIVDLDKAIVYNSVTDSL